MEVRILNVEQRSPEWYAARRGIPTASEFGCIMQPVKLGYAAAADEYINRLIDEVIRPEAVGNFTGNRHTERGCALEPEAREVYAFERDVRLQQVGLVLNDAGTLGCSPDSLVLAPHDARMASMIEHGMAAIDWSGWPQKPAGGLEVKCPDGPTHIRWLRAGKIPAEHLCQVHGGLIVTGLPWWDFMSYCPPYPPLFARAVPEAFTEALRACLERFLGEYTKARKQIEAMA
jgi:hypothetical protein